jgi:hypothetical protein
MGIITGLKAKLAHDYGIRANAIIIKLDGLSKNCSLTARSIRVITLSFNDQRNTLLGCYLGVDLFAINY